MKTHHSKITEHTRLFFCETCKQEDVVSASDIRKHLADVHQITELKGNRSGDAFLDGAGFYNNVYSWTFTRPDGQKVKVIENAMGPR